MVGATHMIDLQNTGAGLDGYGLLAAQLEALLADERDFIANAAQFSAFLYTQLDDLNWAGFYLNRNEELVLGPFQGQIACVRIPFGRGVCGMAAQSRQTQRVQDVHEFPGHIACDSASNSELVVPLIKEGRLIGVLDLDSPSVGRFNEEDQAGIERLAAIFLASTDC
ncbi:GAF domain-containing protein [Pseudomonas syringae pv. atrofaciens]|nr:GAF domain-containing protein [Pseudomonas syringae pv. atrofaciens]